MSTDQRLFFGVRRSSLWVLALVVGGVAAADSPLEEIAPSDMIQWREHSFGGQTDYALTEARGRGAIHAVCEDGGASILYKRYEVDLEQTPVLEWSWRVDETLSEIDETTESGDDYSVRIYVAEERTILRWRTQALNYVWAHEHEAGTDWPNPHNSRAHMVAVRSGPPEEPGTWHTERRNLRRDFERYHGTRPDRITHVAVMTDCDDTGRRLEGWYGTIRFLPEGGAASRRSRSPRR